MNVIPFKASVVPEVLVVQVVPSDEVNILPFIVPATKIPLPNVTFIIVSCVEWYCILYGELPLVVVRIRPELPTTTKVPFPYATEFILVFLAG